MLTRGFKKADLLSYQPKFYTDKLERHKTLLGGVAQIMLMVLNLAGIIYFGKDICQRTNPNVIQSMDKQIMKPEMRFTEKYSMYTSVMDATLGVPFRNESILHPLQNCEFDR